MMTEIIIYFSLFGENFNPEDIAKEINIQPFRIWYKGDKLSQKSLLIHDDCGWETEITNNTFCNILSSKINSMLEIIYPKAKLLKTLLF